MSEQEATLNEPGESSTPMESGDLLSTAEFETPSQSAEVEDPAKRGDGEPDSVKGKEKELESGEEASEDELSKDKERGDIPYSRFKEKIDQHKSEIDKLTDSFKTKIANLEGQIQVMQSVKPEVSKNENDVPAYKNIAAMTKEQIQDWMDDDPLGFAANLATQVQHETLQAVREDMNKSQQVTQREGMKAKVQKSISAFKDEHDDFDGMLKDGSIKEFVQNNPGHDVFSAYYKLTEGRREEQAQKRIDDAVKEATQKLREEIEKDIKAKRDIRSIDGGPAPTATPDSDLRDTGKHGGLTSVLANRLAAMRRKAS